MGMAAGLHEVSTGDPTIADVYDFCSGLPRQQAGIVADRALSFVSYVRSLDEIEASLLATALRNASLARLATLTD